MKLEEPLICLVNKHKNYAVFKVSDDKYLLFNGIQTLEFNEFFEENEYITLKDKDVIPFILVHNMRIDASINTLKGHTKYHGDGLLNIVKETHIENELNTTLTVEDIYKEYDASLITYDELYLWLIIDTQRKYK